MSINHSDVNFTDGEEITSTPKDKFLDNINIMAVAVEMLHDAGLDDVAFDIVNNTLASAIKWVFFNAGPANEYRGIDWEQYKEEIKGKLGERYQEEAHRMVREGLSLGSLSIETLLSSIMMAFSASASTTKKTQD